MKMKYGLREIGKNPVFYKTKEERDTAIRTSKRGAWVLDIKGCD